MSETDFISSTGKGRVRRIYFENRCLAICEPHDQALSDPNAVILRISDDSDIRAMIPMMEMSESLHHVYIPADDLEGTYRQVCAVFKEVNAGGGLVSNRRGDFLLIRRNGLWDLPKGHQDPGEDIADTALREVEEETGISGLQTRGLICITDHCYRRDGIWHLKHTWWYDMAYTDPEELTPQKEEDISKAAWVAKSSLPPFLLNTYPSIAEVFRVFLQMHHCMSSSPE